MSYQYGYLIIRLQNELEASSFNVIHYQPIYHLGCKYSKNIGKCVYLHYLFLGRSLLYHVRASTYSFIRSVKRVKIE